MTDQPSLRRRFQFRLRTLLIVIALAAVANWVIVDRQRLASTGFSWRIFALPAKIGSEQANTCLS